MCVCVCSVSGIPKLFMLWHLKLNAYNLPLGDSYNEKDINKKRRERRGGKREEENLCWKKNYGQLPGRQKS